MILQETLLAEQLFSDHAPPISIVYDTATTLLFTWLGRDERLDVEVDLERRAHWRYRNTRTQEVWTMDHDADEGWPAEAKRMLMRFNRRAA
jgi:hypothetical protein